MVINKPFRIVILGAGYAGMFLAINLYQSLKETSKGDRKERTVQPISKLFSLIEIHIISCYKKSI